MLREKVNIVVVGFSKSIWYNPLILLSNSALVISQGKIQCLAVRNCFACSSTRIKKYTSCTDELHWDKFCGINELQGEEKLPTIKGAIDEHTRRVGHFFNDLYREISKKKNPSTLYPIVLLDGN